MSRGYIERFDKTTKEQHIDRHFNKLEDTEEFKKCLINYPILDKTEKVHKGIGGITPIDFILNLTFPYSINSNVL